MRPFFARPTAFAFLSCLAFAGIPAPAAAQSPPPVTPADVSDAQLGVFKRGMELGCIDAGRNMGQPEDATKAYCGCIMQALNANVSPADWRQAYVEDTRGRDNEVNRLLMEPNLARIRACRPKQ